MNDYYKMFSMTRKTFSKEILDKYYARYKKMFEINYETLKNDEEKLNMQIALKESIEKAYEVLSDDIKREKYNVELDEIEKQKSENKFKKSMTPQYCINMYDSSIIDTVEYVKDKNNNFFPAYTYTDNNTKRSVKFKPNGQIKYLRTGNEHTSTLYEYEVHSISTKNLSEKKYIVLTNFIDYIELSQNPEYAKAVYEGLFSEANLDESENRNFGYIGRLIKIDNDYGLDYDKEDFCAAVDFETKSKKRLDLKKIEDDKMSKSSKLDEFEER